MELEHRAELTVLSSGSVVNNRQLLNCSSSLSLVPTSSFMGVVERGSISKLSSEGEVSRSNVCWDGHSQMPLLFENIRQRVLRMTTILWRKCAEERQNNTKFKTFPETSNVCTIARALNGILVRYSS